jgi:hypothetical protein
VHLSNNRTSQSGDPRTTCRTSRPLQKPREPSNAERPKTRAAAGKRRKAPSKLLSHCWRKPRIPGLDGLL